jgi:hypothetical protein
VAVGTGLPASFGAPASASTPSASPVAFFPDRLDFPTVDPPAASVPADSVAVAPAYQGERLVATAGRASMVTVWEISPGSPLISLSSGRQQLSLPAGMGWASAVAFGHVFGTRREDLVAVGDGVLAVYRRLGTGPASFAPPIATVLPHGTDQRDVALADFNGDGKLDAVVADGAAPGADRATITVEFGNGDGTFSNPSVIPVGNTYQTPGVVRVAALTASKLPDIVVGNIGCGYGGSQALVLLNTGGGSFANPVQLGTNSASCDQAIAIGDLNGDGIPDIVTANPSGYFNPANHVEVFLGKGDGTFTGPTSFPTNVAGSGIAIADLNGDRHPDVAVVGAGGLDVLPGDGTGTLLPAVNTAVPSGPDYYGSAISLGQPTDLNGDHRPDLVIGNHAGITTAYAGAVGPSGGPIQGGTTVTITGHGFKQGDTVLFGGVPAASVSYVSRFELQAVTPSIPMGSAGAVNVTVSSGLSAPGGFRYYVPQIGRLIPTNSSGGFSSCTASVVQSPNNDVIATAGHCVGGGGALDSGFLFAPGFTGYTCPAEIAPADFFNCGDPPPYGEWSAYRVGTNDQWLNNTDHALDYGFLDMNAQAQHIAQAVGGGLPIAFNAARSQSWTEYGQSAGAPALQEVSGSETDETVGSPGPDNMTLPGSVAGGASGGPWIGGTNGSVSAVNSTSDSGVVRGAYLGSEAQATFQGM